MKSIERFAQNVSKAQERKLEAILVLLLVLFLVSYYTPKYKASNSQLLILQLVLLILATFLAFITGATKYYRGRADPTREGKHARFNRDWFYLLIMIALLVVNNRP